MRRWRITKWGRRLTAPVVYTEAGALTLATSDALVTIFHMHTTSFN
jgi:hypothetical protein